MVDTSEMAKASEEYHALTNCFSDPTVDLPYDPAATAQLSRSISTTPRQWQAKRKGVFAGYGGDVQMTYSWRPENAPDCCWQ